MKNLLLAAILALPLPALADNTPLNYAGSYYCKGNVSAGLKFDTTSRQWVGTQFTTDNVAYIVNLKDTGRVTEETYASIKMKYRVVSLTVKETGKDKISQCRNITLKPADPNNRDLMTMLGGYIGCTDHIVEYNFNFENKRFQVTFTGSYVIPAEREEDSGTPYFVIGTCDKIE